MGETVVLIGSWRAREEPETKKSRGGQYLSRTHTVEPQERGKCKYFYLINPWESIQSDKTAGLDRKGLVPR